MFIVMHATELVGLVLPPFIDYLNREVPNENERFLVAVMVCVAVAVLTKWSNLQSGSATEVMTTASIIFLQSQVIFKLYFKNSFIREKLQQTVYDEHKGDDVSIQSDAV